MATETGARPLPHASFGGLRGLKARLAFILSIVLVPALIYSCWLAVEAYGDRRAGRDAAVAGTLRVIAGYEEEFLRRTQALLRQLAAEPDIREARMPRCAELLRMARDRSADYLGFLVLDHDGASLCGGMAELELVGNRRPFLPSPNEAGPFVVSGVLAHGQDGETILAAMPMPESGAMIAAAINPATFARALEGSDLPAGSVVYLVDRYGRLLTTPSDGRPGERGPSEAELVERFLVDQEQVVAARDGRGAWRDYHLFRLAGFDLFMIAGIPALPHFGWLQHELVIGVFAPTLMLALAMVTIWIASDYLVTRHVRTLTVAARAYSRGELDLRLDFASAPAEFQELAHTLARMAGQVQRREQELRASLAEKDMLLREVHHRVKNNLQIVTSLLNLRAQRLSSPAARDAVRQAQMRVAAMTLVHRRLYETDDIRTIELAGLLEDLCGLIEEASEPRDAPVELKVSAEPATVLPDQAIPLALLVTEAVSNAFKHAFPADQPGLIEVRLERSGHMARLSVVDDGVGLAGGAGAGGMGVTLMRMLAKQVGGTLAFVEAQGTRLTLEFPLSTEPSVRHGSAVPA